MLLITLIGSVISLQGHQGVCQQGGDSWVHQVQECPESTPNENAKHKTNLWVSSHDRETMEKLWKTMENMLLAPLSQARWHFWRWWAAGPDELLSPAQIAQRPRVAKYSLPLRPSEQKLQKPSWKHLLILIYLIWSKKSQQHRTACAFHGAPGAPPSHTVAPCKAGSCPTFAQVSRVRASWLSQDRAARLLKSSVVRKKLENYSEMWTMVQKACRLEHRHTCKIDQDRRYRGTSSQPLPARLSWARSAHL